MISNRSDTFHSAVVICVRVSVKQLQHLMDDLLLSRVTTEEGRSGGGKKNRKEFVLILIPDKSWKINIKQYEVCYILTFPLAAANSIIASITSVLFDTEGNH